DTLVFNVPSGAGTLWTVFEMSGDTVYPVNTLSNPDSEVSITGLYNATNDGALMLGLPAK
ncbi:MAG: hypothetical protein OEY67_10200, partial [Gammaproteobacteria bacterium]|nr:hypothetical protein [Gammaproteobacteria bacterium]